MRKVVAALAAGAALLATQAGARAAAPSGLGALCAAPVHVPALGPACPAPQGGWLIALDDGTTRWTHGPDLADGFAGHGASGFVDVARKKPSCVSNTSTQHHIQILYTSPVDRPNRFTARLEAMRDMVDRVNGKLWEESREFGRPMVFRMACQRGQVSIRNVPLEIASSNGDYYTVMIALRRAGYTNPFAKYWLLFDTPPQGGALGVASLIPDDSLAANNGNNYGPAYGVFYESGDDILNSSVLMHEGAHTLGAVQNSSPFSSRGGHCIDGQDVMCYADGGSRANEYRTTFCSEMHFDCRHNDYFHPRPPKGNYLRTHWNLASPLHRFVAGCRYATGRIPVGTAGQDVDGTIGGAAPWDPIATRSVSVPRDCWGHSFGLTGMVSPQPRAADPLLGYVPDWQAIVAVGPPDAIIGERFEPDLNVCFFKGSKRLACSNRAGSDVGTIPSGTTRARVTLATGVDAIWIFSII